MATIEYVSGPVMYARVFENNRDLTGFEGQNEQYDGMYEISVGVPSNQKEFKKIMSWNRMYAPKTTEDKNFGEDKGAVEGMSYFKFKRKHKHVTKAGKIIQEWGGPPKIVGPDGKTPWDTSVKLGNGTEVTIKLNVDKPEGSKITYVRLEGIRIDKHVPVVEAATASEPDVDMSDDIPF